MRRLVLAINMVFAGFALLPSNAQAFTVTYLEYDALGQLAVTVSTNTGKPVLQCRAELEGRPIGGGSGLVQAGVAKVTIDVPQGLRSKSSEFKYVCVE